MGPGRCRPTSATRDRSLLPGSRSRQAERPLVARARARGYPCAMKKLAAKNLGRVLDLLNERLAFERAGVKLYDTILARMRSSGDPRVKEVMAQIQQNRDEEKEHEEWLEEQNRALGGDDHAPSEKTIPVPNQAGGVEDRGVRGPKPLQNGRTAGRGRGENSVG